MDLSHVYAYIDSQEETLVEAVARLVRIPSVRGEAAPGKPFGEAVASALEEGLLLARQWGLLAQNVEGYVGAVDLNTRADCPLHILAHLDVVAAGPGWTVTEAFAPKLHNGLLYGRGVSDDKGPLLAAMLAMHALAALNIPLAKNVRLIMGTDEESGFHDIAWYYARHPYAPYTFSPDASFPLTNVEKGHYQPELHGSWAGCRDLPCVASVQAAEPVNMVPPTATARVLGLSKAEVLETAQRVQEACMVQLTLEEKEDGLQISCHGKAAHASTPEEGNNALTALLSLLAELPLADGGSSRAIAALHRLFPHGDHGGVALGLAQHDEISGPLTLSLSVMDLQETGLRARFDARTPICATEERVCAVAAETLAAEGMTLTGALTPAHYVPADTQFIQTLLAAYENHTGQPGACLSMGGGTYVHGIPGGVAFGACMPGFDSHLHGPDECMPLHDLMTAAKIFAEVIVTLCAQ